MAEEALAAAYEFGPEVASAAGKRIAAAYGTWTAAHEAVDHAKEIGHHAVEDVEWLGHEVAGVQKTVSRYFRKGKRTYAQMSKSTMDTSPVESSSTSNIPAAPPADAKDAQEKRESKRARRPVKGAKLVGATNVKAMVGRLCWHPSFPFPPIMSTTLETEYEWDFSTAWGAAHDVVVAGVSDSAARQAQLAKCFSIQPNIVNLNQVALGASNCPTKFNVHPTFYQVAGSDHVQRTPFFAHFMSLYRKSVVAAARFTVSVTRMEDSGTLDHILWVKKHSGDHKTPEMNADFERWWLLEHGKLGHEPAEGPTGGTYGFFNVENHAGLNRGDFKQRARLYETGIVPYRIPAKNEQRPNVTTKVSSHWSLLADEKVDPYELIAGPAKFDPHNPRNPILDPSTTAERWFYGTDLTTSSGVLDAPNTAALYGPTKECTPKWYYGISHDIGDSNGAPTVTIDVEGTPTEVVVPIGFKIRVKMQQDLLFWEYSRNDDHVRRETHA